MPSKDFRPEKPSIPVVAIIAGVAVLAGIGVSSFGFWLAWHPLGYIAAGLMVGTLGVLLGRRARLAVRR